MNHSLKKLNVKRSKAKKREKAEKGMSERKIIFNTIRGMDDSIVSNSTYLLNYDFSSELVNITFFKDGRYYQIVFTIK